MLASLRSCGYRGKTPSVPVLLSVACVTAVFVYASRETLLALRMADNFPSFAVIPTTVLYLAEEEHETLNRECRFPSTNPFDPALKDLVKYYPPLDCSNNTPHLVYVEDFIIKVNRTKLRQALLPRQKLKHCRYREIYRLRGYDKRVYFSAPSAVFTTKLKIGPQNQNIVVECFSTNSTIMSRSYFSLVRVDREREKYLRKSYQNHIHKNSPLETLSFFMIGIDGMSKQNFERTMPKTRNFLLNKLGGIELRKYNKIGYSTLPNVCPLLTGMTYEEIRDHMDPKNKFFDQVNHFFLWSQARALGYRTGLILDGKDITSFHYQRKGFDKAPVDYYLRPTFLAWDTDKLMRGKDSNCLGDMPVVTQLYDYWLQMARTFRSKTTPYFGYSFAAHLTHDNCNLASKGDDSYHKFLQDLVATGALNNTVIVWFSDHGQRFGRIRQTYQGRVETNTPYMFLIFPKWFEKKYPKLMRTLKINQDRLATHFDVYETIKDLFYFQGKTGNGTVKQRGISLFKEIPRERTCVQAGIPAEFCACAQFSKPVLDEGVRYNLSSALLDQVNSFTKHIRENCTRLSLESTNSVLRVQCNSLKTLKSTSYRVVITVTPGSGRFEGLVLLGKETGEIAVMGEVVRSNLYRGQADCVVDPTLRQFCYCSR